eukprot:4111697-Amphidinium_carterae.1
MATFLAPRGRLSHVQHGPCYCQNIQVSHLGWSGRSVLGVGFELFRTEVLIGYLATLEALDAVSLVCLPCGIDALMPYHAAKGFTV